MQDQNLQPLWYYRWNRELTLQVIDRYKKNGKRFFWAFHFNTLAKFWEYLMDWYERRVQYWKKFRIAIRSTDPVTGSIETISFSPSYRFTTQYRNNVLHKLYGTLKLKLHYWITLTTVAYSPLASSPRDAPTPTGMSSHGGETPYPKNTHWLDWSLKLKADVKLMWKRFYDYQKKYDRSFKYIRVYELTKKNTLHVHIAIYSKLTDRILKKNIVIQNDRFGWIKAYKYTDHKLEAFVSKKKNIYDAYVSNSYESWYKDGKVKWRKKEKSRSSNKTLNYLLKYMSKDTPLLHRAIFTFFRVRTYSVSRNLDLVVSPRKLSDDEREWIFERKYIAD